MHDKVIIEGEGITQMVADGKQGPRRRERVFWTEVCPGLEEPEVWLAGKRPNVSRGDGSTVQPGSMAQGVWLAIKSPDVSRLFKEGGQRKGSPDG